MSSKAKRVETVSFSGKLVFTNESVVLIEKTPEGEFTHDLNEILNEHEGAVISIVIKKESPLCPC